MKILEVTPSYIPRPGGIGRYVYNLCIRLIASGHEVDIVASDIPGKFKDDKNINSLFKAIIHAQPKSCIQGKINVTYYPCLGEPLGNALFFKLKSLKKMINQYDIIHCHLPYWYGSFRIAWMMRHNKKQKYIITVHGLGNSPSIIKRTIFSLYEKVFVKYILSRADEIIALSHADKERLLKIKYVPEKISIIPNGINMSTFLYPSDIEKKEFLSRYNLIGKKIILFLGVINQNKGIYDLISAFNLLECSNAVLLIVGSGRDYDIAKKMASESSAADRIIFTGFISYELLPQIYASADVFILPSYSEGLPTTIIEALSLKTPTIGTNIPSVREYFSKYIPLVEPGNIIQIKESIENLLKYPPSYLEREEIAKAIRKDFDSNKLFEKYEELKGLRHFM